LASEKSPNKNLPYFFIVTTGPLLFSSSKYLRSFSSAFQPSLVPSPQDKEVFDLAASAMNRTAGHLQRPARKVILDAFKKARGGSRRELGSKREDASMNGKIYDIYIYVYPLISAVQYGIV